jgi:hypothetical protein
MKSLHGGRRNVGSAEQQNPYPLEVAKQTLPPKADSICFGEARSTGYERFPGIPGQA